ncbi:MAG TPA: SDR family oxidoreductase [Beijerinckiaceae bacterium]|jgi:NAD(P)-dependent dehydrogenase (short-subunit alcohol dehydrogenase family)
MNNQLKPVEEQVIVLTGASSGIGLATARALAERGAKLVLAARNAEVLADLVREIEAKGGEALAVETDVSKREDLERLAQRAKERFGGFDTWINNAAVAIYGSVFEVPLEDHRQLIETNYWGVVNGSLIAAEHLKTRGGKIINTGSVLSERAMMLQAPYSASKHAVKGFTDGLRMEIEEQGMPISVTLIKPSAIDTPYMEHARTYLDEAGTKNPPPAYDPAVVAKAMVFACEHEKRELTVGFGGFAIAAMATLAPRLTDYAMELTGRVTQTSHDPGRPQRRDNLYRAREDGAERSSLPGGSRKTSLFLEAQMHPVATFILLGAVGAGIGALLARGNGSKGRGDPARDYDTLAARTANGQGRPEGPDRYGVGGRASKHAPTQPRA